MICLDTSIIIEIFDGNKHIEKKLSNISSQELSINPIILCELYKGAVHSNITEKRLNFIEKLLQEVDLLNFNEHACKIFGEDYIKLKNIGKPIKDNDLIIASICKAHNATLITADKSDFYNIPHLKLEVW